MKTNKNNPIIDLAEEIVKLMDAQGHPNPRGWKKQLNPVYSRTTDLVAQRMLINSCWLQILLSVPMDLLYATHDARGHLIDTEIEPDRYLYYFNEKVIPCSIALKLG